ncbi:bifunctional diguanylate cyclase/phosphodiesterase [Anaerotruncus rubiinfantis]|uniref:bifunctional diguanylate cyclase/phosphodiesterase n=1 Tax=Anaerotruncus rubiinfantis TaxID=1720200 RepID=UPI000837A6BD|nr:bifunctional diguanylate cyclase/phosphodiesterase [Anaerotruncus rubiinfantis]
MFFNRKDTKTVNAALPAAYFESPNRPLCLEKMEEAIRGEGKKKKGAIIKLYIENFKLFNDTFGYDYGGLLLEEIARFMAGTLNADVYRYAGVEFISIMEGASFTQASEAVERVLERFESTWRINDLDCMCAVDMGVVLYPERAQSAEEAAKHLDLAVSESASKGQNQYTFYNQELEDKICRKQIIAQNIKNAIKSGEGIEVRYRPTFNLERQQFTRAEGYLRLFSPELGVLSAQEFLPVAEELGLICAVNEFELRRACKLIKELLAEKKDFETIAVLISPIMFLQEHFPDDVRAMLKEYDIPANKLAFEITESVLIDSFARVNIVMQELSDMEIEFVLNEFGTGYSGINNILSLPIDVLKLERLFVWQLEENPRSGYIIQGLIQIAHNLGLKLIAEGVETENQIQRLAEYGCRYEQGFYYSPTVDVLGLKELLNPIQE